MYLPSLITILFYIRLQKSCKTVQSFFWLLKKNYTQSNSNIIIAQKNIIIHNLRIYHINNRGSLRLTQNILPLKDAECFVYLNVRQSYA